jgi:hypothetical protein
LSKLINAEYASLKVPAFSKYSAQTLETNLNKLCEDLEDYTNKFACYDFSHFGNIDTSTMTSHLNSIGSSLPSSRMNSISSYSTTTIGSPFQAALLAEKKSPSTPTAQPITDKKGPNASINQQTAASSPIKGAVRRLSFNVLNSMAYLSEQMSINNEKGERKLSSLSEKKIAEEDVFLLILKNRQPLLELTFISFSFISFSFICFSFA